MTATETLSRLPFLTSDGEMIDRVRALDWSTNPLGEPAGWPAELVAAASFVLESRFPTALTWGPQRITIYNDAFRPILGDKHPALGEPFDHIWREAWDVIGPICDQAYAGKATYVEDFPLTIDRFGYAEAVRFTFCYSPVRLGDGRVAGMIDTVMETTNAVAARERSRFLNNELGHRLKNTMAMVQAIAAQSLRGVVDRDLVNRFSDRILALGHANDLLLQANWKSTSLHAVIDRMLALHGGDGRFHISGPDVVLGPTAALSASLLLHELATNAAKHGALSVVGGRVQLYWRIEQYNGEAALTLHWEEIGGPPAVAPTRKGFGSRIINLGLSGTGMLAANYKSTGFDAAFRAPLQQLLL